MEEWERKTFLSQYKKMQKGGDNNYFYLFLFLIFSGKFQNQMDKSIFLTPTSPY